MLPLFRIGPNKDLSYAHSILRRKISGLRKIIPSNSPIFQPIPLYSPAPFFYGNRSGVSVCV
ncbi:hypothetical protein BX666DRAFT_1926947 [Dichotomocladium elegans]|nr:hypothetical protein BX666DRAFT_1926947 [Dichotomocladium elegans]